MFTTVLDIGSQVIAKGLREDQRRALRELSTYLKSIKKLVKTLGPKSLDEYCRYGYLSEEKIRELEKFGDCLHEDKVGIEEVEEDTGSGEEPGSGSDNEDDGRAITRLSNRSLPTTIS